MPDFYTQVGKVALGSRLRRLSESFSQDASKVFELYKVALDAKWYPVFQYLSMHQTGTVTEIADAIGHSHASVSQIVREMTKAEVATTNKSKHDGRISLVELTDKGRQLIAKLAIQSEDVAEVVDDMLLQAKHNLWLALEDMEFLLSEQGFYSRVLQKYRDKASAQVEIVTWQEPYLKDFKSLNLQWIQAHFEVEQTDLDYLERPIEKIIQPGGEIFFARQNEQTLGTCALVKSSQGVYELSKMAVTEAAKGKHIGYKLGQAVIEKAKALGASTLFLESNTKLTPAINLYKKLGFKRIPTQDSMYQRCNIRMQITF